MPIRLAKIAAIAGVLVGVIAIPVLATLPSPLTLCTLRPPFECIAARLTGSQYVTGDSPAALAWLITSFLVAPLASLGAVWLVQHHRIPVGRAVAAIAILPNLILLAGTYAVMPFHPIVFLLTLAALVGLLLPRQTKRSATTSVVS